MEYALLSPYFTEKFTMSYKLITLMKTHGESVKRKMFTKLQIVFKDMQLLMTGKNFTSDFLQCFLQPQQCCFNVWDDYNSLCVYTG